MIGGDHRAGARHVLHDESRIARNMLAHEARVSAGILIVIVAGLIADDDADGFALIEGRLGEKIRVEGTESNSHSEGDPIS